RPYRPSGRRVAAGRRSFLAALCPWALVDSFEVSPQPPLHFTHLTTERTTEKSPDLPDQFGLTCAIDTMEGTSRAKLSKKGKNSTMLTAVRKNQRVEFKVSKGMGPGRVAGVAGGMVTIKTGLGKTVRR